MKAKKDKKALVTDEKQIEELKAQVARALADYDNLKKRTETEKSVWFKVAGSRMVSKFLPIKDMLEDAQKHLKDAGLGIVLIEFKKAIEEEGFEEIKIEVGVSDFDASVMEVIETVETTEEEKNNKVAEIVLGGWKSKSIAGNEDSVVRHAKVKVYSLKLENN